MNVNGDEKLNSGKTPKKRVKRLGKDAAYVGVFVALLIASQLVLSPVPGVELVTVLFVTFSFSFGVRKGVLAATVFSLLRQLVFGFYPQVLVLYLCYFNGLTALFGCLGKCWKRTPKNLFPLTAVACACTAFFTILDNIVTPLWYGYSARVFKLYFYASFSVMIPQIVCTAVSVSLLFLPLTGVFERLAPKKGVGGERIPQKGERI